MLTAAIAFIAIIVLLVLVHECGHYLSAKFFGVTVEEFGFGFPPKLSSIRRGDTEYSFNLLPLGGFVRLKGEQGDHAHDVDSFASQRPWKRLFILLAGVVMNIMLAGVLLSIGYMIGLPEVIDASPPAYAHVFDQRLEVLNVLPSSPAEMLGIKAGDTILSLADNSVNTVDDFRSTLARAADSATILIIEREGTPIRVAIPPSARMSAGGTSAIGVELLPTARISYTFPYALWHGMMLTGELFWEILKAFGGLFIGLIHGQGASGVAGPVGIAILTGRAAHLGFTYLLQFAALLSLNLAILNVIPFPALDGGRAFFVILESIRGKSINHTFEQSLHLVGFLLLIVLVLFLTVHELSNLSIWSILHVF